MLGISERGLWVLLPQFIKRLLLHLHMFVAMGYSHNNIYEKYYIKITVRFQFEKSN